MMAGTRRLSQWGPAILALLLLAGCSSTNDASLSVRIAVEVDEYDNTALTLGTNAPLLGRGFAHGVTLSPGENKTVTVPMYDKGTIVRICGAAPSGGAGTAGGPGGGGRAGGARLGPPLAPGGRPARP